MSLHLEADDQPATHYSKKTYNAFLYRLQVELVKLQRHFIANDYKILIILEGRDAAGKDGLIKRITEHLSPRETRVVALGKPSDKEKSAWYFQRYVPHLPVAGELVLFNRSWYNRAGVERVMGFCSDDEYQEFMASVVEFEHMLVRSGLKMFKYYLDIPREEQARRLAARKTNPLKQWKTSPIDEQAIHYWDAYTQARDQMLAKTHTVHAPWTIVHAIDKRQARINVISDVLARLRYSDKDADLARPDTRVVMPYNAGAPHLNQLAR